MKKQDLISIVVPIYNVEKYLEKCINSIIIQTYKNIEIILVNDGSTDSSGKICDIYLKKDKRIKVVHKKNGGLSDARNVGIENAKGKYIAFIDSDDFIDSDFIEILYNLIIEYNADVSCCKCNVIYKKNKKQQVEEKINIFTNYEAINEMLYQGKIDNSACNKLYKLNLFEDIKYPKSKYFEDLDTTYKIFLKSDKIVATNKKLYNYYQRTGSILHKKNEKLCNDLYEIINSMEKKLNHYSVLKKAIICRKINACFYIYRNSNNKILKEECKKIVKLNRCNVLKDKNINKKTKYGLYLSYLGMNIVNIVFKILKTLNIK